MLIQIELQSMQQMPVQVFFSRVCCSWIFICNDSVQEARNIRRAEKLVKQYSPKMTTFALSRSRHRLRCHSKTRCFYINFFLLFDILAIANIVNVVKTCTKTLKKGLLMRDCNKIIIRMVSKIYATKKYQRYESQFI